MAQHVSPSYLDAPITSKPGDRLHRVTRDELNAAAERLKAHAVSIGLCSEYYARITWANEGTSVYLSLAGARKIRVSDHGAAYGCSISVDPEGLTEEQAIAWLNAERADEIEADGE